jgi:acetolactate synthase-1/2/3 large subunit
MTKFAEMIIEATDIRYLLEKALFVATHGRPGPVWLDVPLDVQAAMIETGNLRRFNPKEYEIELPVPISDDVISMVYEKLRSAKRPVILVGKGLRMSGGLETFTKLVHDLQIPVVTGMSSVDALSSDDPVFVGRAGITGDRAGNLTMQNSDLLLSLGNRLSFSQIGYNFQMWARAAYKIAVDIDPEELKKPILNIDFPVCGDAKDFVSKLYNRVQKGLENREDSSSWVNQCRQWKEEYPVVSPCRFSEPGKVNIYAFYWTLTYLLDQDYTIVVSAGTARAVGSQASIIKSGQRFISNSSTASMGYGLPAAIGACLAKNKGPVVCVTGDGSLQMNIQELQTIKHNNLPIKIFVINNEGYQSIRVTQNSYFPGRHHVGIGEESGDLSFPNLSKIANAYGYPYYRCEKNL